MLHFVHKVCNFSIFAVVVVIQFGLQNAFLSHLEQAGMFVLLFPSVQLTNRGLIT